MHMQFNSVKIKSIHLSFWQKSALKKCYAEVNNNIALVDGQNIKPDSIVIET